jgi:hypothetical protein
MGIPSFETPDYSEFMSEEKAIIANLKKVFLMVSGAAKLALLLDVAGSGKLAQGTGGLKIAAGGVSEVEIASSSLAANAGLTGGSGAKLAVNVDNASLEVSANVVGIKDAGVTTAKIADSAVTNAKLQYSYVMLDGDTGSTDVELGTAALVHGVNGINVAVTTGDVAVKLTAGLDNLSDVEITGTPGVGETLVSDGTGNFKNLKAYHLYTASVDATSHTVNHNIGQKYCNVTVVDGADEVVIPQSITFNDESNLTVTFTSAIFCRVVVMGMIVDFGG